MRATLLKIVWPAGLPTDTLDAGFSVSVLRIDASLARPTADDFLSIIRRQQLGKLKIYLGACPGVGKTYAMLKEGHRLRQRGVDVVIGYVEPHERPETIAQIGDLELVSPRRPLTTEFR